MFKSRQNGVTFGTSLLADSYFTHCTPGRLNLKLILIDGGRKNLVDQSSSDRLWCWHSTSWHIPTSKDIKRAWATFPNSYLSWYLFYKQLNDLFLFCRMKATVFFLVLVNGAMVLAIPAIELNNKAPPASGCYPLCVGIYRPYQTIYWQCYSADPHCGVANTFCRCRDGKSSITLPENYQIERNILIWAIGRFYLFNRATGNCDPPWGYVGDSVRSLPGYHCRK